MADAFASEDLRLRACRALLLIKGELIEINCDRLHHCVGDPIVAFNDRKEAHERKGKRNPPGRRRRSKRAGGRERRNGSNRAQGGEATIAEVRQGAPRISEM